MPATEETFSLKLAPFKNWTSDDIMIPHWRMQQGYGAANCCDATLGWLANSNLRPRENLFRMFQLTRWINLCLLT